LTENELKKLIAQSLENPSIKIEFVETKKYMTIEEAAEYLGIPVNQFRKFVAQRYKNLPTKKIGKRYIFRNDILDRWYERISDDDL